MVIGMVIIISAGIAASLALAFSLAAAYKTVNKTPTICQPKKIVEDEVSLDDICEKYLRLTNCEEDMPPHWPAVRNSEETFEEFMDKGSNALIKEHPDLVKGLI